MTNSSLHQLMDSKTKHISGDKPEILQPFSVYTHFHTSPTKGVTMNQPKIIPFVSFATHLFFLLFLLIPATGDLINDIHYLLEFSEAVPHGRKLNWDFGIPICTSWVGVTCTSDGSRVLALRLPGIGLYGPIPAHTLGQLDALRILSLRSNGLSGSLPSDISTLPSLQYLFLQHNHFSDIPDSLSSNLKVLDLSFNSLRGNIPLTFQNLTQLTGLSLQNNSLSGPIPAINLPKLRYLNLSNNNLNGSVPSSLQRFPKSSFAGNLHLCLSNCSPIIPSPSPSPSSLPPPAMIPKEKEGSRKKLGTRIIIAIAVGGAATLILLVLLNSVCYSRKKRKERNDEQAKPVLLCAINDNTVRLYDLPSFNERGKIFAKEEIREIQIGPGGIFFTGNVNGELKVESGGQNQPQLASWDEA